MKQLGQNITANSIVTAIATAEIAHRMPLIDPRKLPGKWPNRCDAHHKMSLFPILLSPPADATMVLLT
jgi:hypothetical protein